MKINELLQYLARMQREHGNIPVYVSCKGNTGFLNCSGVVVSEFCGRQAMPRSVPYLLLENNPNFDQNADLFIPRQ